MKVLKKIINALMTLIIAIGGLFLVLYFLGIVPYVVLSGSMEPTIKTGSLCFVNKNISIDKIKEKDIIAFKLDDGTLVTHRVKSITEEGIITKGDSNKKADNNVVTKINYVGKDMLWIPKLGYIVMAFRTTNGKIIFLSCIAVLFICGILFGDDTKKTEK
jgi:signal peptidase